MFSIMLESLSIIQGKIKDCEAENASAYSNLLSWKFNQMIWKKGRDVKLLLIGISFIGLKDEDQNKIRQRAHKIAEYYRYQGEWNLVEELLQLNNNAPGSILQWYLTRHSVESWFGNDLNRMIKLLQTGKTYNPYLSHKQKVKKPQRKRGYADKGSLSAVDKLPIEYWIKPRSTTETKDLQQNSFFPDWYSEEKDRLQEALRVSTTSRQNEGGEEND